MADPRILAHLFEAADGLANAAEPLARPVDASAQALLAGLTGGARVWIAALGPAQPLGQHAAALLQGRFERDRPGLTALALDPALAGASGPLESLVRQLETWAHPGDQLWLLMAEGEGSLEAPIAGALAAAAHERDCAVLAWMPAELAAEGGAVALLDTDVLLALEAERPARRLETLLVALHACIDALDRQLLGEV